MAGDGLAAFLREVAERLGPTGCVTDADVMAGQVVDWTGRWQGGTPAVLRPGSTEDVAAVVAAARRHAVALVPQGGNTGLVGGSVPLAGEVVLDLRRLDHLGEVDLAAAQVTVGAGVTLAAVQAHVSPYGLEVAVDLASRDTATVGGMAATNAGGVRVLRHGPMRAQVLGVEAVLGTGTVVTANLTGLVKDNTGYDLPGLLCGSEGTLAVLTALRLRLVPTPPARLAVMLAFPSLAAAVAALPVLRSVSGLSAIEAVAGDALQSVADHLGQPLPVSVGEGWALLVEVAGEPDRAAADLALAMDRLDRVTASAAAADPAGLARLWRWREAVPEAAAGLGLVHKADVTLPHAALAAFDAEVRAVVDDVAPGATTLVYGHLGDGNLHVNLVGPAADDDRPIDAILDLALRHGGSVSAEHGIGTAKRRWLVAQRGEAAVAAMRAIKEALDPGGILNPHVLLP